MYQDNNQENPIDYLNQIAPKTESNNWLLSKKPLIIGLIAMAGLLIVISAFSMLSGNNASTARLAARLSSTGTLAKNSTKNIKSTQLRATNANLSSYLTNAIRDIEPFLAKEGIKIKSIDKTIVASEATTELDTVLENARLNAIYDRTYAREMAYKLDTIITLMNKVNKNSSSKSLRQYLTTSVENLTPIKDSMSNFNADNS